MYSYPARPQRGTYSPATYLCEYFCYGKYPYLSYYEFDPSNQNKYQLGTCASSFGTTVSMVVAAPAMAVLSAFSSEAEIVL
jgi:hypothetical protein